MNEQISREALRWIHSKSEVSVDLDDDLFANGILDSLSFNELIAHLEEFFDLEADFGQVIDWRDLVSVSSIVSLFSARS